MKGRDGTVLLDEEFDDTDNQDKQQNQSAVLAK